VPWFGVLRETAVTVRYVAIPAHMLAAKMRFSVPTLTLMTRTPHQFIQRIIVLSQEESARTKSRRSARAHC
jgi:hypothetical protein